MEKKILPQYKIARGFFKPDMPLKNALRSGREKKRNTKSNQLFAKKQKKRTFARPGGNFPGKTSIIKHLVKNT